MEKQKPNPEDYIYLAISLANTMFKKTYHIRLDDLISEAFLQLCIASNSYNPDKGCKFSTYAYTFISGRLIDYVRKEINQKKLKVNYAYVDIPSDNYTELMLDVKILEDSGFKGKRLIKEMQRRGLL